MLLTDKIMYSWFVYPSTPKKTELDIKLIKKPSSNNKIIKNTFR